MQESKDEGGMEVVDADPRRKTMKPRPLTRFEFKEPSPSQKLVTAIDHGRAAEVLALLKLNQNDAAEMIVDVNYRVSTSIFVMV